MYPGRKGGKFSAHLETSSQVRSVESFRISEGNETMCVQEAKQKEYITVISHKSILVSYINRNIINDFTVVSLFTEEIIFTDLVWPCLKRKS